MVDFAGFNMPVQYESIIKEHEAVRTEAGVFDVSHMGEFLLEGNDVIDFLQYIMINDLSLLEPVNILACVTKMGRWSMISFIMKKQKIDLE